MQCILRPGKPGIRFAQVPLLQPLAMKWTAVFLLFFLFSCSRQNTYNRFLSACNRVDIVVYNGGDTLHFDTQDSTGIRILADQVTGNNNNIKDTCAAQGRLRFRQDSTVLLEAPFAVTAGNNNQSCNYIAYDYNDASYVQGLSERAKKLLGTVMQRSGK